MPSTTSKKIVRFKLHTKQSEAWQHLFTDKKRTVALISGVQGGKTIFGALALLHYITKVCKNPSASFLVGAPTYKILQQSTLPTFQKIFRSLLGDYNGQEGRYKLKDGRSIWFRTSTDPDSVEGVPDVEWAWIDEAGKCSRRFWVNAEARLARCQGQLLLTTTWYSLNWLYKSIWQPYTRGDRHDIGLVYFNSAENPTFPKEELERQRFILSRAEYSRKFLGEPSKPEGLIFSTFDDDNWADPFPIDHARTPTYMGVDWGFDHPLALTIRALVGDGMCYTVSIFKRSGLSVTQAVEMILSKAKLFNVKMAFCGHDRPDMIVELNRRGVRAVKYFEGKNDLREVNPGNQKHDELVRTNRYKVFKGIDQADDLEDEYLTYSWDGKEDNEHTAREKPINVNDDLMAAERYCTVGIEHMLREKLDLPKIPARLVARIDRWKPTDTDEEGPDGWMGY